MPWRLIIALGLMLFGGFIALYVQSEGGQIQLTDVRWRADSGHEMSALLYVPRGVDANHPAPAVLAVHGYINSRETQDGFAIELARRGFVVLALDQTGHGYSSPPAFAGGFGGPAGLQYLRSLSMVDSSRIGLTGHSMGGWAVLSAASAYPQSYKAIALVGSAPGLFGTPQGSVYFPNNLALVFGRWDEFAPLMWEANTGRDVANSAKLKRLTDLDDPVAPGVVYGDIAQGTARVLYVPDSTHPGNHFSQESIGYAIEWFDKTLGVPHPRDNQIWLFKEFGTLVALLGLVLWLVALPSAALDLRTFQILRGETTPALGRWGSIVLLALIPVLTYFPLFKVAPAIAPVSSFFPQEITNGLLVWVAGNGLLLLITLSYRYWRRGLAGVLWPNHSFARGIRALSLALLVVGSALLFSWAAGEWLLVDFRFWVVAVKFPADWHWLMMLSYAPALCAFFMLSGAALAPLIDTKMSWLGAFVRVGLANVGGFVALLAVQYLVLLSDRPLPIPEPLLTIIAMQFVVLLLVASAIFVELYRRTGTLWLPGFVNGLFITWVVVAGTATQGSLN